MALLPTVVVQDELRSGRLVACNDEMGVEERARRVVMQGAKHSVRRHFEPPLLKTLLKQSEAEVLRSASS